MTAQNSLRGPLAKRKGTAMSKHGTALSVGQFVEFSAAVTKNLPRDISPDVAANWANNGAALAKVLHEALCPPCSWREEDGVVYFSVTSDGTGPEWEQRLEQYDVQLSRWAKDILRSPDFKPTTGVTYEVAVLKGMLWNDRDRITKKIRADAYAGVHTGGKQLSDPNAEIACLIREKFPDDEIKAMGLWWIVAMHEPIEDSDGGPGLLSADRDDYGSWLNAYCGGPGNRWYRGYGFALVLSQVAL